jgi:hypothetical protein
MPRTNPKARRRPASRPRTIREAVRPQPFCKNEQNTKRRGELAELAFTLKAATLGFAVSKPYGDSERYDFIVDARPPQAAFSSGHCHPERSQPAFSSRHCHPERSRPESAAIRLAQSKDPVPLVVTRGPARNSHPAPVHPPPHLYRIQVKCSTQLLNGLYRINAHRRVNGRAVPYRTSEIDFIAAYVIPEDTWYLIPLAATRSRTSLLFRRKRDRKPGLYDNYKEAWHLLRE